MDTVSLMRSLTLYFLLTLLLVFSVAGEAGATVYAVGSGPPWYSSRDGACNAYLTSYNQQNPNNQASSPTVGQDQFGRFVCLLTLPNGQGQTSQLFAEDQNATASDTPCGNAPASSGLFGGATSLGPRGLPSNVPVVGCIGGYSVTYSGGGASKTSVVNGQTQYFAQGQYEYECTGGNRVPCTSGKPAAATATAAPPEESCGSGQTRGLINGRTVCFSSATGQQVNTNANGATGGSTSGTNAQGCNFVVDKASGAKTTTCPDGTTTVEPGANPQDGDPYCKSNPTDPQCAKNSFAGTCTQSQSSEQCDGDSVTCAIARAAYETACELQSSNTLSAIGESAASGSDPKASQFPTAEGNVTQIGVTSLDQSSFLSGSCPADQAVSLPFATSLTIPWSRVCAPLQWLGFAVVAVALMAAARIVGVWG